MYPTLKQARCILAALALTAFAAPTVWAQSYTFSGAFTQDDNVFQTRLTFDAPSLVTLQTTSYARGGFDPILSLFDSSGLLIAENDDGFPGTVPPDPSTGNAWDADLVIDLNPGTYTIALTQWDNYAAGPNLSNGFVRAGQGNFTGGPFRDADGNLRNGSYTLSVTAEVIPEPGTCALAALGLLPLAGALARRRA
jgi:hypothetical protein